MPPGDDIRFQQALFAWWDRRSTFGLERLTNMLHQTMPVVFFELIQQINGAWQQVAKPFAQRFSFRLLQRGQALTFCLCFSLTLSEPRGSHTTIFMMVEPLS